MCLQAVGWIRMQVCRTACCSGSRLHRGFSLPLRLLPGNTSSTHFAHPHFARTQSRGRRSRYQLRPRRARRGDCACSIRRTGRRVRLTGAHRALGEESLDEQTCCRADTTSFAAGFRRPGNTRRLRALDSSTRSPSTPPSNPQKVIQRAASSQRHRHKLEGRAA